MPLQQTRKKDDFALADLLRLHKKEILLELNCHAVGIVRAFNPIDQTATISIAYTKTYFEPNPLDKTGVLGYTAKNVNYPLLLQCPVVCLGGGLTAMTFPITPGDECLVIFNDRDISNWFGSGQIGPVNTLRLHSMSDGFVLVGIRSLLHSLVAYDSVRAGLTYRLGTVLRKVAVGPAGVLIANELTTLNTILQSLLGNINTLIAQTALISVTGVTPGGGVSGPPANAAAIAAVATAISANATQLATLLE